MYIVEQNGDILEGFKYKEFSCLIQNCNAQCTMRSGVAWQIREAYPQAYEADCKTIKGDRSKMGTFTYAKIEEQYIFNLYGQYRYGYDGKQYLEYDMFRKGLEAIRNFMIINGLNSIGMPWGIGACRAGGKWEEVYKIIEETFKNTDFEILIYKFTPKA